MKTWTMPRVEIEAFRANEYCSTCQDPEPILAPGQYLIVDFLKNKTSYPSESDLSRNGGDDWFYDSAYEKVGLDKNGTFWPPNKLVRGWFKNVSVSDRFDDSSPQANVPLNTYGDLGHYDVYVSATRIWFYAAGTADTSHTPSSQGKIFS